MFLGMASAINEEDLNRDDKVTLRVLIDQLQTFTDGHSWRL